MSQTMRSVIVQTNPWENLIKPQNRFNLTALLADASSVLKFYWAINFENSKLFLLQLSEHIEIKNKSYELAGIDITIEATNGKQHFILSLKDNSSLDIFYIICNDLLQFTKHLNDEQNAVDFMLKRIEKWHYFLKSKRKTLDKRQLLGLVSELYFMKNELFPKFGIKTALSFWQAPLQEKQDFILHDTAIEIKTKSTQNKITISSFEQLNSNLQNLFLYVLTVTESDSNLPHAISAMNFIDELKKEFANEDIALLLEFEELLFSYGYTNNPMYKEFYILIGENEFYKVTDEFPKISSISQGIESLSYKINLEVCKPFKIENFLGAFYDNA